MLKLLFNRRHRNCEGTSRRDFLRVGALGLCGLNLADLLAARALAAHDGRPTRNTSVVWLWLNGGPTHIETFDPKMTAPSEFRSVTGEVKTTLPGVTLGSHFSRVAQVADKMAFVRSFAHDHNGHNNAAFWMMSGYPRDKKRPSMGSVTAKVRGPNHRVTGMPTYVGMGRIGFNQDAPQIPGPKWLGQAYAPFNPDGQTRTNMKLTCEVERLEDRRSLLTNLDRLCRDCDARGVMDGIDAFDRQAVNLILGEAPHAFDLKREDPRVVEKYGGGLGAQMLLARRLCEAGCGFVTVSYQGWDMHGNVKRGMDRRGPDVDRAVATFVEDIYERGLDENIVLVVTGEFGRTPRINKRGGRDHWCQLSTLALSGGGLEMGQAIGESSPRAEVPQSNRVSPQDLMATLFHVLGIDPSIQLYDPSGRPLTLVETGKPIVELV